MAGLRNFIQVPTKEIYTLSILGNYGFQFDWSIKSSIRSNVVSFVSDGEIAGLVEYENQPENTFNYIYLLEVNRLFRGTGVAGKLLAYVAKDSLAQGYDGFVISESKTVLVLYYMEKYGAKRITGRTLYFDTDASKKLIEKYLGE